jgi:hypothetical protein
MKYRLLVLTLACSLAPLSALRAEDAKPKPAAAEETELELTMDRMNTAFRKVRNYLRAPDAAKTADTIAQVAIMRETSAAALKLEPAMKADKPAEEQAKFVAAYQEAMKRHIGELVKLEDALKAGNNEEAAKIFAGIADMQKKAHTEFKRPPAKKS